jgi:hypothetical protein
MLGMPKLPVSILLLQANLIDGPRLPPHHRGIQANCTDNPG